MPHVIAKAPKRVVNLDYGIRVTQKSDANVNLAWPLTAAALAAGDITVEDTEPAPGGRIAGPGFWLPSSDWDKNWRGKLGDPTKLARAAIIGDSIGRGYFSSNINTKGWAAVLASRLQAAYGDGGSGWQGVVDTDVGMTAIGVGAGPKAAYASQKVGATGTWTSGGDPQGPGSLLLWTATNASSLTFKVRGTSVDVYFQKASNGVNGVPWTIDGVAQTPINMNDPTKAPGVVTVDGLADGLHTVVITHPNSANVTTVYGCVGRKATGTLIHNYSRFGTGSGNFLTGAVNWSGGPLTKLGSVDLLIYAIGANDASGGTGMDAWAQNLGNALRRVREYTDPKTDLLIVLPHIGNFDNNSAQMPGISSRARGIAEAFGAGLLNFWGLGRNSWAYWNQLGYWSDGSGSGAAGADNVHPSDAGHAYMADVLTGLLG